MKLYASVCVFALSGILAACSGSQFNKGSTVTDDAPATPLDTVGSEAIGSSSEQIANDPSVTGTPAAPGTAPALKPEDKTALTECLKQWPTQPFTPEEIARPQTVEINESINNNGLIYADEKITAKNTLYLVNFNISVGNNGELKLLNPKGWYCFNVKAKVINNFVINTACGTHVAIVAKQAQNDKNFTVQTVEPCPS